MILGTFLVLAPPASAQIETTTKNGEDVDCRGLKLVAASGIPAGPTRKYTFHGICKILRTYSKTGSFAGFEWDKGDDAEVLASVWVDLVASWNSQTGYFKEQAKIQSPYAGGVSMELRCAGDPVLTSVSCTGLGYSNTTGWDGFDHAYAVPRPISRGKTTLAEATALSQQQAANAPPTPPPPPPAPSPVILRSPVPSGTDPVAVASPQIPNAPTRSPSPTPTPPPESSGTTTIALAPAVQVELQDGRSIIADGREGALRWALVGPNGQLMRRFPAGTKLSEHGHGDLTLEWPGGSYRAGHRGAEGRPAKARHPMAPARP